MACYTFQMFFFFLEFFFFRSVDKFINVIKIIRTSVNDKWQKRVNFFSQTVKFVCRFENMNCWCVPEVRHCCVVDGTTTFICVYQLTIHFSVFLSIVTFSHSVSLNRLFLPFPLSLSFCHAPLDLARNLTVHEYVIKRYGTEKHPCTTVLVRAWARKSEQWERLNKRMRTTRRKSQTAR